ncbi:hypothetical protein PVL29_026750 [Vitis rotundifolia]|uniref:SCP domain-containing protein n=1 Tax=Vitis rotundifolia TaxID=103349 RepID=A0AA39D3A2_VITRO|nr:hypothetical protein PVL29_026750 [Vitis rotundifolia]
MVGLAQTLVSQAQNTPRDFLQLHVQRGPQRDYAKQRSGDCELVHSGGPYGENIHWGYGGGYTDVKAAMKLWLDEKHFYDYESNSCMFGKNSKRLGCASAACPDERVFCTCNYDPPGNFHGECTFGFGFSYKVHRNK